MVLCTVSVESGGPIHGTHVHRMGPNIKHMENSKNFKLK